jgi:hypothetical protein
MEPVTHEVAFDDEQPPCSAIVDDDLAVGPYNMTSEEDLEDLVS